MVFGREIKAAGFVVEAHRYIEESISGSVAASERSGSIGWKTGDVLIFTEFDCFGRNVMDVRKTVEQLAGANIRVH
jgi:putative DNA-invertase from lambdoid prophage Rac